MAPILARAAKSGPPPGVLKREWLAKHRTRVPAVVAAFFGDEQVYGDPAQWLQVCTDLENLKYGFYLCFLALLVLVIENGGQSTDLLVIKCKITDEIV